MKSTFLLDNFFAKGSPHPDRLLNFRFAEEEPPFLPGRKVRQLASTDRIGMIIIPRFVGVLIRTCLAGMVALAVCTSADGKVATWTGKGSLNDLMDPANWRENQPPGQGDEADFSPAGEEPITLAGDVSIGTIRMQDPASGLGASMLNLHLDKHTLDLLGGPGTAETSAQLVITAGFGVPSELVIRGGILRLRNFTLQGKIDNEPGVLRLEEAAVLESSGAGSIGFLEGSGVVRVTGGARWIRHGAGWQIVLGHWGAASGLLEIRGSGSAFEGLSEDEFDPTRLGLVVTGYHGNGEIQISEGGSFESDVVTMGGNQFTKDSAGSGSVGVEGVGSSFRAKYLYVGGGLLSVLQPATASGSARFYIRNGAKAEVGSLHVLTNLEAGRCGSVSIEGGSLMAGIDGSPKAVVRFSPNSELAIRLGKGMSDPPFQAGNLDITGARLVLTVDDGFQAKSGEAIPLVSYFQLEGEFIGLVEGETIEAGKHKFVINYRLGGQNVIGLSVP